MKADERDLLKRILDAHGWVPYGRGPGVKFADAFGEELGMPVKRVEYLLEKWSGRGWWEYGVTARSGWFTPEGVAALRVVIEDTSA